VIVKRRSLLDRVFQQEDINFVLTNRIPRRLLTRLMGWFSEIEQPLVRDLSIATWKLFAGDPQLHEARKTHFASLHDCFVRELKEGARPVDTTAGVIVSPCDGVVGAFGRIDGTELIQAKGSAYSLEDLLVDRQLAERYRDGVFVTLRLTASMYHRFHAPYDCTVDGIHYVAGDTWNVNPITLKRVARLFCRNERVVIETHLRGSSESVTLVPVGAILVASICLNFVAVPLTPQYRGPSRIACRGAFAKGNEMGYFRHGSTIVVLASRGLVPAPAVQEGQTIRMGTALLCHPDTKETATLPLSLHRRPARRSWVVRSGPT
jgi:phosphatidylserine decarboxylase